MEEEITLNLIQQGLESVIVKRKELCYEVGRRGKSWLKFINYQYIDVLITGLRKGDFGLLLTFLDGQLSEIFEIHANG
jgi:DNA ligase 1